jgi:hypothetical protein
MRLRSVISIAVVPLAIPAGTVHPQAGGGHAMHAPAARSDILGTWRVVRSVPAPWATGDASHRLKAEPWIGRTVGFEPRRVVGPGVLRCANAVYTPTSFPADALFQGALPAPAERAAEALGLTAKTIAGTNLSCDSGDFELHRADESTLLIALSDVVYTLARSPGTRAPESSPAGVVQRLLERHFAGDMSFDRKSVATKERFLSEGLSARIARYFSRPTSPNEAPVIDGDPFTDSQEYPARFTVTEGVVAGNRASVLVRFAEGHRVRPVTYVLRRERGGWRVDDVRYDAARDFTTLLE